MKRDISGLFLLLAMPAALIIVMALIQDAPFKDYQELKFDLLVADNDHGSAAKQITDGLRQSRNFKLTDSINNSIVSETQVKQLVNDGKYKIGLVIPQGITAEIANSANIVVNDIARKAGLSSQQPVREIRDTVYIHLYFDPASKPSFRTAIRSALDKYIAYSCTNILMERLSLLNGSSQHDYDRSQLNDLRRIMQGIGVKEAGLDENDTHTQHLSSVQHNVPAWAIFGMFFIVIPIAGHIIREREDGSALRIALIPYTRSYVTIGKILFYTCVCSLQFALMICIGLYAMPLFGLPSLYAGTHAWLLLPVCLCISFVATAYGFFIGSIFKTINQALPFGSISIVILSAIGGIWVPIEILPHTMQAMALVSPLHWALEAVNQVILRNGNINSILLPSFILILTGTALWIMSAWTGKTHK